MKKLLSLVLSFALVCTLISGCGPKGGGGNSSNQPLDAAETTFGLTPLPESTTLTIGFFSGSAHSMPWYIADRMGFFDELNIDVEYESFIGGPAMMEASASWDICDVGAPGILNGMKNYDIIGRAFAMNPDLLLMDEPYGQMDIKLRFYLEDEVVRLWKETGSTVLFITHNIEEAVYLAERILILSNKPTTIKEDFKVDLPRPRDVTSPEFTKIRQYVTDQIKWW
ncbi:hypothetical protein L0N06_17490 [Flavonifractor plautii]|uniref:hypothetical protein n=1 Tax=Flavonifractor plautii TaxID=292800 RepID=UPI001EDD0C05|nr:hypothetical protein [Flavonifractor plautii]